MMAPHGFFHVLSRCPFDAPAEEHLFQYRGQQRYGEQPERIAAHLDEGVLHRIGDAYLLDEQIEHIHRGKHKHCRHEQHLPAHLFIFIAREIHILEVQEMPHHHHG